MAEFAVLLPVYVLLLVSLIYFSNVVLVWQEGALAARFLSTNTRTAASGGGGGAMIAHTSGANVPQDYFIYGNVDPVISASLTPASFTQAQVRDELIKRSWYVSQSFDLNGNNTITQTLTGEGTVVYDPITLRYGFDGDDALIAEEISDWFTRGSASVRLTYDSQYIRVGKWTLPAASVTTLSEGTLRNADNKQRSTTASSGGMRRPIEDLLQRFGPSEAPAGSLPMPDYPDFMSSNAFWVPN